MRRIVVLATAGVVLAVLVVAQLLLPGIAAQRLRDRLAGSGQVLHVEVDAFPALELLWHRADRVVIRLARYQSSTNHLDSLLDEARHVGSLDASASELDTGLLTLRDATLSKRGNELTGRAHVTESDIRAALPILHSVQPVASGDGQLTLRGTASLLGVMASVDATLRIENGQLVVQPDVPLGALATVTVFGDPGLEIQAVSASTAPGGFSVSAQARLR